MERVAFSNWAASARERWGAVLAAGAFLIAAAACTPFATFVLPPSFPLFGMVLAASFMSTTVTGFLLLFQARALRSDATLVIAAGFFYASATMVFYAIAFPRMFAYGLGAGPATSGVLWLSWHAGLLASMVTFGFFRSPVREGNVPRRARTFVLALAIAYVVVTLVALYDHRIPPTYEHGHWTPFFAGVSVPIIVGLASTVVFDTIRRRHAATVLDLWLGLVAFAIIIDVYLTLIGATRFSLGWYASRIVMLLATMAVLGMLLRQAAQMYASLVVRAQTLDSEAHTDPLTALPNRRRLDEELARAFQTGFRREDEPGLALAMIDIDRFKAYNDAFGHPAGDRALQQVARAIAESVARSGDFAARFGGEEFVVILEETSLAGAIAVGERIRSAVLSAGIRDAKDSVLSVSVGVAARHSGDTADDLLRHADEALYVAKNAGRNRVVAWERRRSVPVI